MIETFADELTGGLQDAGCLGRQCVDSCNEGCPLFLRHPTVQHEWRWHPRCQGGMDGVKVLGALGQHQHLATLFDGQRDVCGYAFRPGCVMDQMPEYVLDAGCGRQVDARKP